MNLHIAGKFDLDWVVWRLQPSAKKKVLFSNDKT